MYEMLSRVNHPHDLKALSLDELKQLAAEIRQRIAEVVDKNGGHFGSNLGTVELTLAIHRVFDVPRDRLVWDTSHQSYPHKLVTGRRDRFHEIRKYQGICGFTNKKESIFDLFDAGHAGTACGLALGVAAADKLFDRNSKSIAVVGDSAIVSGMSFEALNHAGELRSDLIVVLNDNKMSIDHPVGAFAKYLNKFRTKPIYRDLKRDVHKAVASIPVVGKKVEESLEKVHGAIKNTMGGHSGDLLFQELGFNCFGPIDGHDLGELIELFENLKKIDGPVFVHAHTVKGHGYDPALDDPVKFHALKGFLPKDKALPKDKVEGAPKEAPKAEAPKAPAASKGPSRPSYSQVFKQTVHELARKDRRVCAITAGMSGGTGLTEFGTEFPDRFYDVGIAEQHGAAFASGLTHGGCRPIFACYSTFCQRAFDQIVHDVAIQENPVIFCLDRAGIAGEDGWTHHGMLDIAYMRTIPNCIVMAPRDGEELIRMIEFSVEELGAATAIRYPKATVPDLPTSKDPVIQPGKSETLVEGEGIALFAYGSMVDEAYQALPALAEAGIQPTLVNARFAKPIDVDCLEELSKTHHTLVTLEEHNLMGGFGGAVTEAIADRGIHFQRVHRIGVPDRFVSFGSRAQLMAEIEIDTENLVRKIQSYAGMVSAPAAQGAASSNGASANGANVGKDATPDRGRRMDLRV
ncbi:MAG: 1-deoxy-D-xylulose-5-phosphate synthase [Planctomycetota bacterium]